VLEGNSAGNEILAPLSAVILGGLLTSTFLNLVLVPAGYAALHASWQPESATQNH
jgi:Cu/Ag efflux pump CusA